MATVHDTAAYILKSLGPMTAMKLQKLVYYAQAWSLVWDDKQLFDEPIQAWVNGPFAPRSTLLTGDSSKFLPYPVARLKT